MKPTTFLSKSVLVVEDDHNTRVCLRAILESAGFEVLSAPNGQDALQLLRNIDPPDLILLDLFMPIMDGWEFLRTSQNENRLRNVPVVAISGMGSPRAPAGVRAIFQKPFDPDQVVRAAESFVQACA